MSDLGLIASSASTCKSGCNPENPKKIIKIISKTFLKPIKYKQKSSEMKYEKIIVST